MSITVKMICVLGKSNNFKAKDCDFIVESLSQQPQFLSQLTREDFREWLLEFLTLRSDRLITIFRRIRTAPPSLFPIDLRSRFAQQIVDFLLKLYPTLPDIMEEKAIVELLGSALAICLKQEPSQLSKLASSFTAGTLRKLFADQSSGTLMQRWVTDLPKLLSRDASTLEIWTKTVVHMAEVCQPDQHSAGHHIKQFKVLTRLIATLSRLEKTLSDKRDATRELWTPQAITNSMSILHKDDKKRGLPNQTRQESFFPQLDEASQVSLGAFGLDVPHSGRTLDHTLEQLKFEKTHAILAAIAMTFPCSRCEKALISDFLQSKQMEDFESDPDGVGGIGVISDLDLDVLGQQIGTWRVLLSQAALKSLQAITGSGLSGAIQSKLVDLASMCAKHRLAGSKEQRKHLRVPLATTKCGKDMSILWQIDVGVNGGTGVLQQEVKVWDIGNNMEIPKAIEHVITLHQNYTEETVRQCRRRPDDCQCLLPLQFDRLTGTQAVEHSAPVLDVRKVEQETIDMAQKFYVLTEPVLRSLLANNLSAQFPFDLSEEEATIIKHSSSSSLILGRSGTGKTTCLVFKLVAKFLASKITDKKPLKQVLLTRSSHLAQKLHSNTIRLIRTLDTGSSGQDAPTEHEEFGKQTSDIDRSLDDALTLQDTSFPLICTFDCFLLILENTVKLLDRQNFQGTDAHIADGSPGHRPTKNVVDFASFRLDYWPRFPSSATKRLPIALVFSEIMGIIKGSASSRETLKHLSRDEYLERSSRLAPNFSEKERPSVYDIFELYEELKLKNGETDYIDRGIKVLAAVRHNSDLRKLLGSKIQELYIDEVQDQRTMDIELFLSFICDSRGFHFAGDTAQAITEDSTFRFEDIRALLYDHFATASAATNQPQLAKPTMFKLAKNYRSHQGILRLAALVMNLLWKGFPDRIDRLEPEVGQLCGPMPIVFLGCDVDILTSTKVGHVSLSQDTAEFGAEQVILVRDEAAKTALRTQIGDAALVLTILQSKGMEFDDVILWEFFSECPNATGVRNLSALLNSDTAAVYARQHLDMCAELKRLYVAVTRARFQLFIIERDENVMQSVIKLFRESKNCVMDVTTPADPLFEEKLRSLRPGYSTDPRRWVFRGIQFMDSGSLKDALFCFRRAQDRQLIMTAEAKIHAEDGRIHRAKGDLESAIHFFDLARSLFMELRSIPDAAMMLEAMDRLDDAALLWRNLQKFGKAAELFSQAGLYVDAADCYACDGKYVEAAIVLRQGGKFNEFVMFISNNKARFDDRSYHRFTRLCKLLLKQEKISKTHRKEAIGLLGSPQEQEVCFREYDMHGELVELYSVQRRYADIYLLQLRLGQLEEALGTAIKHQLASTCQSIPETQILALLDFVCVGQLIGSLSNREGSAYSPVQAFEASLTPKLATRFGQWKIASSLIPWEPTSGAIHEFDRISQTDIKAAVSLLNVIYPPTLQQCSRLADIPCNLILEAICTIKGVILKDNHEAKLTLKLVTGLQSAVIPGAGDNPAPWSCLQKSDWNGKDGLRLATAYALEKLTFTISAFESRASKLWRDQNPEHCLQYLTRDFCYAHQRGECSAWRSHAPVTPMNCAQNMTDLLRVVHVICEMNGLYYRRVLNPDFQRRFLPMKRRWLEPLIQHLTFISPLEQDSSTIVAKRLEIADAKLPCALISSLDDLLFVRLRTEWGRRSSYSAILEQLQLSEILGTKVMSRFHQALSFKLASPPHLHQVLLPRRLRIAAASRDTSKFERYLFEFVEVLRTATPETMASLYSVVTELESMAVSLIMATSSTVCLLSQRWLDANISLAISSSTTTQEMGWFEKTKFINSLFLLTRSLCEMLGRMESSPPSSHGLAHHPDLLRQRNADFLAIVAVNLATYGKLPFGFRDMWDAIQKAFGGFYASAYDYRYNVKTPTDLQARLQTSFSRYNGKDSLVLLFKEPQAAHPFIAFKTITKINLDELKSKIATQKSMVTSTETRDQYTSEEIASVTKIQQFWRRRAPRHNHHKQYLKSNEGQLVAKYISMGSSPSTPLKTRVLLITKVLGMNSHLDDARAQFSLVRKQIMSEIEGIVNDSDDRYDVLDASLHQLCIVDSQLEKATTLIADGNIRELVAHGVALSLESVLDGVSTALENVFSTLGRVRKSIELV